MQCNSCKQGEGQETKEWRASVVPCVVTGGRRGELDELVEAPRAEGDCARVNEMSRALGTPEVTVKHQILRGQTAILRPG